MAKSRESVYDAKVYPLMEKVIEICKEHRIPLFAHFLLEDGKAVTTAMPSLADNENEREYIANLARAVGCYKTKPNMMELPVNTFTLPANKPTNNQLN